MTPGIRILGDQELLTQALADLVEHALRHPPAGTRIGITLTCETGSGACLAVEDDGPPVPAEDLPRLADRFHRAERRRTAPGNGLRLSLVAAVADLHGASLYLKQAAPGLGAVSHLPLTGPARGLGQGPAQGQAGLPARP